MLFAFGWDGGRVARGEGGRRMLGGGDGRTCTRGQGYGWVEQQGTAGSGGLVEQRQSTEEYQWPHATSTWS